MTTPLLHIDQCPNLMADAYLCDDRRSLIFLSVWGRDTAIQELLARLTLKGEEGINQLTLVDASLNDHLLFINNADDLDKRTTRTYQQTRFGGMVHLWLFDKRCLQPDRANGQAMLLLPDNAPDFRLRIWRLLQETCTLPLLDHWQDTVLDILTATQMLIPLPYAVGRITGYQLSLDIPRLSEIMGQAIVLGELRTTRQNPQTPHSRLLHAA